MEAHSQVPGDALSLVAPRAQQFSLDHVVGGYSTGPSPSLLLQGQWCLTHTHTRTHRVGEYSVGPPLSLLLLGQCCYYSYVLQTAPVLNGCSGLEGTCCCFPCAAAPFPQRSCCLRREAEALLNCSRWTPPWPPPLCAQRLATVHDTHRASLQTWTWCVRAVCPWAVDHCTPELPTFDQLHPKAPCCPPAAPRSSPSCMPVGNLGQPISATGWCAMIIKRVFPCGLCRAQCSQCLYAHCPMKLQNLLKFCGSTLSSEVAEFSEILWLHTVQ